jgi:large subunit ribosomal protein L28
MSRTCQVSGKRRLVGFQVSHAHNKSKKIQQPNLQWKRIFVPEEDRFVRVRVSTSALRTITRKGLVAYLADNNLKIADVT